MKADSAIAFRDAVVQLKIGKRLPNAVYVHRCCLAELPLRLRQEVERAEVAAQPDCEWNIIKFHEDQFATTFLTYPDFDTDPHPALTEATKINLKTGLLTRTDYRRRANPPILHRKETFLSPSDERVPVFSALTKDEEAAGLYRDSTKIGLRVQWLTLLKRLGYTYSGHDLVPPTTPNGAASTVGGVAAVERHRTAIKRYDLSRPVKVLLQRGLLTKNDSFFDYGCGHGMDVEALSNLGYEATGWDPAFRPNTPRTNASVVNLGYVLNVVEDREERASALRDAYALTKRLLLVSTLVAGQQNAAHTTHYRDGYLTKSKTFQKFYAPGELESLIEQTLDVEAITLGLGICAVFRDKHEAELFEASRNRRRIDWSEISAQLRFSSPATRNRDRINRYALNKELFDAFWEVMLDLGRAPEAPEFDRLRDVRMAAGGLNRAVALAVTHNGQELWEIARKTRFEDVLVYLAMANFRKRFLRRELPPRIKFDIRSFFGDLGKALERGRQLLFAAGDPDEVELALDGLTSGVFEPGEGHFTFHRTMLATLPPILRVYVYCAALRYGNPEEADLIKIHVRSGKLTFLQYDDFEKAEHPVLRTRIKINLRNQFVQVFDHSTDRQPLIGKQRFPMVIASK